MEPNGIVVLLHVLFWGFCSHVRVFVRRAAWQRRNRGPSVGGGCGLRSSASLLVPRPCNRFWQESVNPVTIEAARRAETEFRLKRSRIWLPFRFVFLAASACGEAVNDYPRTRSPPGVGASTPHQHKSCRFLMDVIRGV